MRPGWRPRTLAWLTRRLGTDLILPTLTGFEAGDSTDYGRQRVQISPLGPCGSFAWFRSFSQDVDGILLFVQDVLMPRNLEAHLDDGFQAVREALRRRIESSSS